MFDLCRELSLTFEDVALAIGWLAREDKIFLRKREGMLLPVSKMSNLLLAKVVANLYLRWISTLLFTQLKKIMKWISRIFMPIFIIPLLFPV